MDGSLMSRVRRIAGIGNPSIYCAACGIRINRGVICGECQREYPCLRRMTRVQVQMWTWLTWHDLALAPGESIREVHINMTAEYLYFAWRQGIRLREGFCQATAALFAMRIQDWGIAFRRACARIEREGGKINGT